MTTVYKFRLYCETEEEFREIWDTETPIVCPSGVDHILDSNVTSVIETVSQENQVDDNGNMIVAPSHGHYEENGKFKGFLLTASGNNTTISDYRLDRQIFVTEGYFWTKGGNIGDFAEFSIVDKDDILGLFSTYGLEVGVDVLELGKFVETQYINPDGIPFARLTSPTEADVCSGLYMRTKYKNTGDQTAHVGVTYLWLEV